jgi:hypothetical protein
VTLVGDVYAEAKPLDHPPGLGNVEGFDEGAQQDALVVLVGAVGQLDHVPAGHDDAMGSELVEQDHSWADLFLELLDLGAAVGECSAAEAKHGRAAECCSSNLGAGRVVNAESVQDQECRVDSLLERRFLGVRCEQTAQISQERFDRRLRAHRRIPSMVARRRSLLANA